MGHKLRNTLFFSVDDLSDVMSIRLGNIFQNSEFTSYSNRPPNGEFTWDK